MKEIVKIISIILIIAVAMIGSVTAAENVSISQPIGGDRGYYDISSSPSGASASVDGTSVGLTPTTATIYVTGTPGIRLPSVNRGTRHGASITREIRLQGSI